jgi:hypothetical protein
VYFLLFIFFVACENATELNKKQGFRLKYRVINHSDYDVGNIEMESITYFPDKDHSAYKKKHYSHEESQPKNIMDLSIDDKIYLGCTRELVVSVSKKWDGINEEWKLFFYQVDTVQSIGDSLYVIHWPQDSSKAIFVRDWL